MKKMILPATFLTALLSVQASARAGAAATTPTTITVDVELTETVKKVSETVDLTMTLGSEGSCATASSDEGSVSYQVELCRGRDDGGPVFSFEVKQRIDSKARSVTRHVKGSSKLAAGTRTVVGRIAAGDEATEIAATVR